MQKMIAKETEKGRRKWTDDIDVVQKHIVKLNKRQDKYKDLVIKAMNEEKYSTVDLKMWCSLWKKTEDNVIPSKAAEKRAYTMILEDREPLTVNIYEAIRSVGQNSKKKT